MSVRAAHEAQRSKRRAQRSRGHIATSHLSARRLLHFAPLVSGSFPRGSPGFLPPLRFGEGGRGGEVFGWRGAPRTSPPSPLSEAERGNRTWVAGEARFESAALTDDALH